jgi:hypothetical protein
MKLGITVDINEGPAHNLLETVLERYTRKQREIFWQNVFGLRGDEAVGGFLGCVEPVRT